MFLKLIQEIDWVFIENIFSQREIKLQPVPEDDRKGISAPNKIKVTYEDVIILCLSDFQVNIWHSFFFTNEHNWYFLDYTFDPSKFQDAVVIPWYRNQVYY